MIDNIINHEKGIFNNIITYILGDTNCVCPFISKKNKGYRLLFLNKHINSNMKNYMNKYFKSCVRIKGYVKNVIKTKEYIMCKDHKLTHRDVGQLNILLSKFYNNIFNSYSQLSNGNNIAASYMYDTSNFIHTDNMDNFLSFIKRHVDSNKLIMGNKCCSGTGIKLTIDPVSMLIQ